jgi:autotransporter-associated beta strand protein
MRVNRLTARRYAMLLAAVAATTVIGKTAQAVTRTWDGGGTGGTDLNLAANWSGDVLPNNGDTAEFNNTVAGPLSLTWASAAFGGNGIGTIFSLTGAQTNSVTITNPTNNNIIRLAGINIASGAGAFTLGGANVGTIDAIALGSNLAHVWTNNSANAATIGSDIRLAYTSGVHTKTLTLGGTGDWNFGAQFANAGTGSLASFTKTGSGTLTITADTRGTNSSNALHGGGSVFLKTGTTIIGNGGVLWSDNPQASPGLGSTTAAVGQSGSDVATLTVNGTGSFISGDSGSGDFSIGEAGSSQGTLNIADTGSVLIDSGGGFFVGSANAASSTASGTVNQSGGTLTANKTTDGFFIIGGRIAGATGSGTYNLSGGTVTNLGRAWIGGYGTGSVVQTGGTWNNTESVSIARQAGSTGTYNISAGSLNQTTGTTGIVVGREGNGTLTVSGSGAVSTNSVVTVGGAAGAIGTVNLNGGSITTPLVNSIGGTSTFNFNGGTLKPTANNAAFFVGLTRANVRNGGAIVDTNGSNITIGQPLLHSNIGGDAAIDGGLTKNGAGTLTMSGGSSYTGPTNVAVGTLAFDTAASSIGSLTVADNATLGVKHTTGATSTLTTTSLTLGSGGTPNLAFDFNNLNNPTAALISTGALTANGAVGVTFANASLLSSGSYTLISYSSFAGGGTFPGGSYTFSPRVSGTIANNGTNALLLNVIADKPLWTGLDNNGTTGNWVVGTTGANANWKLQTAGTPTDYIEGDAVVFDDSATGVTSVDISAADVAPVSVVFDNSSLSYTIASSGNFGITGTGLMIKNNTGAVTIANSNSYTGGTTINAGTLSLNAANALGTGTVTLAGGKLNVNNASGPGTGAIVITGGTLDNTNGSLVSLTTNNLQSWNGNFAFDGSNDLNMGNGLVTLGGAGTSRTVTVNAGALTVGRIIGATQGLTKAGPGRLAITTSAASVIAGTLNVTGGVLQINTGVDSGTTNDFQAAGLAGSGTIENGGGAERWLYINTAGADTFNGTLQDGSGGGALGLNKQGLGTLTLAGASTYTGVTTLSAGSLIATNTASLGNTSRLNPAANVTTTFTYATDGGDNTVPIGLSTGVSTVFNIVSDRATPGAAVNRTMTSTAGLGGGTINFTSGPNVTSGTPQITFTQFALGAGSTQTTTLNPVGVNLSLGNVSKVVNTQAQTLALDGTSSGNQITGDISNGTSTSVGISKTNTSTWRLSGNNSYTGTTTLTAGTLIAASATALGNTDRMNVTGTSGPTFIFATDGSPTDAQVPIGMSTNASFTVVSDRATAGAAVDRTMTVPITNGLGGGVITFTSGANVTSGTPRITFNQLGLGAGGGSAITTLNPVGVNLSIGTISKFNNTTAQTIELGGTSTGNEVTGPIFNGAATTLLRKSNTGTWTLTGLNTYTGGTGVFGGVLQGNSGSLQGNFTNNASVVFDQAATGTYGGNMTGSGTLTKQNVGDLTLAGTNSYAGNTIINGGIVSVNSSGNLGAATNGIVLDGGTLAATGAVSSATRNVSVLAGNGTIDTAANAVSVGNVDGIGNFTKSGSGGNLTVNHFRVNNANVTDGIATAAAVADPTSSASVTPGVSIVNSLVVSGTGTVNLTNNRIITNDVQGVEAGGIYDGVQGLVQSGKIFTQEALFLANQTAIGVATAAESKGLVGAATTLWSGQTVDSNDTLVMYTWAGDANLDGKVNADDYASIDLYSTVPGADSWNHGDFNYNGVINADDYALIDNNVQNPNYTPYWTTDQLRNLGLESSGAATAGLTAVPEPTSIGLLMVSAAGLLGRRRRRCGPCR